MSRGERPLDEVDSELGSFASDLRKLREKAGSPTYRELASHAHYSAASLSDAAGGRKLPTLAVAIAYVRACGGDEEEWEQRWRAIASPPAGSDEPPYAGLAAFERADADRFFGREKLTAKLLDLVSSGRFVGVFGASGSGKSSLLRAGLAPKLDNVLVFTPGAQPIDECAVRLAEMVGESPVVLRDEFRASPANLALRAHGVVLVVDQFEEVFTLADAESRDWFVRALTACPRVVIGVRADFYGHCGRYPELVEAVDGSQLLVGPMTTDELRRAITEPAVRAGAQVEGTLVTRLVADVAGQAAALPLVSHVLVETWRRRRGITLTLAGYEEAGGVTHAIARTAEAVFESLTEEQRSIARHTFLRMIALGEGTEDTKRRVRRADLDADVLERLVAARLVTLGREDVELSHEALIRSWPRLRDWLAEDRAGLLVHHQLTEATTAWEALDRDPDALYRGVRLAQTKNLGDDLTGREREFLDASRGLEAREQAAGRRRTRRLRQFVAVLAVLVLVLAGVVAFAVVFERNATEQRDVALALRAATQALTIGPSEPQLAAKVALAAYRIAPTPESRQALLSGYSATSGLRSTDPQRPALNFSHVAASGRIAMSTGDEGTRLWSVSGSNATPRALHPAGRDSVISTDGRIHVGVGPDGVQVWDISDLDAPKRLTTLPVPTHPTGLSDDGRFLVGMEVTDIGGDSWEIKAGAPVIYWDISDPEHPHKIVVPCSGPALRPDGQVVTGACRDDTTGAITIKSWKIDDQHQLREVASVPLEGKEYPSLKYSPSGRFMVVLSWGQGSLQVWDMTNAPGVWFEYDQHIHGSPDVAFGRDEKVLAMTTADGISFWDIAEARASRRLASLRGVSPDIGLAYRSAEDDFVAAVSAADRHIWQFDFDVDDAASRLCGRGDVALTEAEWERFFPGVGRRPVC